ncbi:MAG: T9SS type A sorting domain-containing protein [Bacteroidetes bacterium]|nr:T9SS type A sorting domain-containing protein [Bacteroidota bacterium]
MSSGIATPYNTDPYYIQHNGLTVKQTASAAVQIGETYHIKMGIANTADNQYSSAAWIEGGTFAALDRFTLTVDAGYNVGLSDTIPVLYQSSTDSVFLRFNRWGGFYLDEYLQLAVGGDAVAGVDYLPIFPDSLHFSQLDSAVVLPIALPVHATETRDLVINLITSGGNKVADYHFILAGENTTGVRPLASRAEGLVVFPNPANQAMHVSLPSGMKGPAEVNVLDMIGRVVLRQGLNAASGTLNLEQVPNGLYTVKVEADGQVETARVSVKH